MQDIDPRLKTFAKHFGFQAQAEKAIEEMAELMVDAGISLGMETFARAAQLSSAHGSDQCFDSPKNSIV